MCENYDEEFIIVRAVMKKGTRYTHSLSRVDYCCAVRRYRKSSLDQIYLTEINKIPFIYFYIFPAFGSEFSILPQRALIALAECRDAQSLHVDGQELTLVPFCKSPLYEISSKLNYRSAETEI